MAETTTWRPAANGAGKRQWFVCRGEYGATQEYHEAANGYLVRFASIEGAQRAADRLNAEAR